MLAAASFAQGCAGDELTPGASEEPFLYLVVAPRPIPRVGVASTDSTVYALLLSIGTPLKAAPRIAERFQMTRRGDGAMFAWRSHPVDPGVLILNYRVASLAEGGNYALSEDSTAAGRGRRALRALDTLDLRITTGGRTISGSTVIPARPELALSKRDTAWVVHWRPVAGAAGYHVSGYLTSFPIVVRDSQYVLFSRIGIPGTVDPVLRVTAIDTNLFNYFTDSARVTAGVDGAFGVLGAVNSATIRLEPALALVPKN